MGDPLRQKAFVTAALKAADADSLAVHVIQRHTVLYPEAVYPEAVQLTAVLSSPHWQESFDLANSETARQLEQEIRAEAIPGYVFRHRADPIFELKYAVLHLHAAAEVLLKARLVREHWSLVFRKPDKAEHRDFMSGNFRSIGLQDAIDRLRDEAGLDFPRQDPRPGRRSNSWYQRPR